MRGIEWDDLDHRAQAEALAWWEVVRMPELAQIGALPGVKA